MNFVFHHERNKYVVVYIDNILVYSKSEDNHVQNLTKVLGKLKQHNVHSQVK